MVLKEYSPYLEYKDGVLHFDGVNLLNLAKEVGTPVYVYSANHIRDQIRAYKKAFPDALIAYAVKANFNLGVIKIAAEEGCGADTVSGGEIYRALKGGIPADKIVYAGVGKTEEELLFALEQDILMFNAESEMEIEVLNELAKSKGKKARIAVRVNPDVDPKTHPKIATGLKKSKFGIDIHKALEVYKWASSLSNIEVVGIHCHIGSQLLDLSPFGEAVEKVVDLYKRLKAEGIEIKYIDIGGGLGIKYKPEDKVPTPQELADIVLPKLKGVDAQLILEPGRSIAGNGGILITQVQFLKEKDEKLFVMVDAGFNDLLRPAMYGSYHHIVSVKEREEKVVCDIVGPICETGDILGENREICKVERKDYLAILSAGAYGFVMSSHYNMRPRAVEVIVENGSYKVTRPRENWDYIIWKETP
ncbi:MAG: diaminopimelate decarboxylase [Aquificaceae bacterium]|nr:MAG: diaminopimelate decarboxylase [Aquificaceae bacterium]